MTKPAKLYLNLLANSRQTISFRDFEALLAAFGFELARITGSHHHYRHPAIAGTLTVTPRGKDANGYQVRQFCAMVEKQGLKGNG